MTEDILGPDFTNEVLPLPDDYEGKVIATLVRREPAQATGRAVLYVHGYVDYFFQKQMAEHYVGLGYTFYALDLRKYGRSLLPEQTPNFCKDVSEYFAELDQAVEIIRERDGHQKLLLSGHSTGGLIASLYADKVKSQHTIQALFLNSPFFEFNENWITRELLTEFADATSKHHPFLKVPGGLSDLYGRSLHRDFQGEWEFDLNWKPCAGFPATAGWLRAIHEAQQQVQAGLTIDHPVLVMCSAHSSKFKQWDDRIMSTDAVLNADDISRYAGGLGGHVTKIRIEGGMHDLILSQASARESLRRIVDLVVGLPQLGDYSERNIRRCSSHQAKAP